MKEGNIQQSGFRTLSSAEITAVSGGEIVVNGVKPQDPSGTYGGLGGAFGGGSGFSESGGISEHAQLSDGGGGSDFVSSFLSTLANGDLSPEEVDRLENVFGGLVDGIKKSIEKDGDFPLKLPDGSVVSADQFVKTFSRALIALEVGTIGIQAAQGEPFVADAAKLLLAIGFAASLPATVGPIAVFSAAVAAGVAADFIVDRFIESVEESRGTSFFDGTTNDPDKSSDFNLLKNLSDLFNGPNGPTF